MDITKALILVIDTIVLTLFLPHINGLNRWNYQLEKLWRTSMEANYSIHLSDQQYYPYTLVIILYIC